MLYSGLINCICHLRSALSQQINVVTVSVSVAVTVSVSVTWAVTELRLTKPLCCSVAKYFQMAGH